MRFVKFLTILCICTTWSFADHGTLPKDYRTAEEIVRHAKIDGKRKQSKTQHLGVMQQLSVETIEPRKTEAKEPEKNPPKEQPLTDVMIPGASQRFMDELFKEWQTGPGKFWAMLVDQNKAWLMSQFSKEKKK